MTAIFGPTLQNRLESAASQLLCADLALPDAFSVLSWPCAESTIRPESARRVPVGGCAPCVSRVVSGPLTLCVTLPALALLVTRPSLCYAVTRNNSPATANASRGASTLSFTSPRRASPHRGKSLQREPKTSHTVPDTRNATIQPPPGCVKKGTEQAHAR
jgi:hypothetical protein